MAEVNLATESVQQVLPAPANCLQVLVSADGSLLYQLVGTPSYGNIQVFTSYPRSMDSGDKREGTVLTADARHRRGRDAGPPPRRSLDRDPGLAVAGRTLRGHLGVPHFRIRHVRLLVRGARRPPRAARPARHRGRVAPGSVVSEHHQHQLGWVTLTAVIAALAIWSYFQVFTAPDYGTDEIAFDQYAAQLALHGINPYLHSMAPAFPLFHVSPNGYTFQLNGQPVTALSYPALAFEAYLPLLAAGVTTQARRVGRGLLLGARRPPSCTRSCRAAWHRWPAWWRASTSTSATRSAGSPTRCSCRC